MTRSETSSIRSRVFHRSRWSLIIILLVAAFFRLYRLDEIPPGLTHDEADTGHFFAAVYHGARSPVQVPYGYGYEPLPMYTGALFMQLFGSTDLALRLHSAFFGLALLVFTYLWAKRAFSVPVGLGGAALALLGGGAAAALHVYRRRRWQEIQDDLNSSAGRYVVLSLAPRPDQKAVDASKLDLYKRLSAYIERADEWPSTHLVFGWLGTQDRVHTLMAVPAEQRHPLGVELNTDALKKYRA